MSTINANIADYLKQIEALTQTNLQLLKTINESFSTSKNNLMVEVNETQYVVPSFVALENKINLLQENFDNLVNAPECGEAAFNFNGNTRTIEVRKYNSAPPAIGLTSVNSYSVENNNMLRDMLTILPCVKFDLSDLADDIVDVNVKKVIPKSDNAIRTFKSICSAVENASIQKTYSEVIDSLSNDGCSINVDYIEYDTIYKLPIKQHKGSGEYIIKSIEDDYINDTLENIIKLKIDVSTPLTYKLFNDIDKPLSVGDELTTYDGAGKVVVAAVNTSDNILTVKVVNGEYLNLVGINDYDTTVTEYLSKTTPDPQNFVQRNRIVAGLSDVVVVVESAIKGGSLITANIANDYNRDVMAFPGRVGDKTSEGCNKLIRQHKAEIITSAEDLINLMGWTAPEKNAVQQTLFNDLTPEQQSVIDLLKSGPQHINIISINLDLSIQKTSALLTEMVFDELIDQMPGDVYTIHNA